MSSSTPQRRDGAAPSGNVVTAVLQLFATFINPRRRVAEQARPRKELEELRDRVAELEEFKAQALEEVSRLEQKNSLCPDVAQ